MKSDWSPDIGIGHIVSSQSQESIDIAVNIAQCLAIMFPLESSMLGSGRMSSWMLSNVVIAYSNIFSPLLTVHGNEETIECLAFSRKIRVWMTMLRPNVSGR